MMKPVFLSTVILLTLAGCATVSTEAEVEALRGSPALQRDAHAVCLAEFRDPKTRNELARLMNVRIESAPRIGCNRLVGAMVSGRLTPADIDAMKAGRIDAKLVRVLQGR